MPSASKLFALLLLSQTAFSAALPAHVARADGIDVLQGDKALGPLMIRAALAPVGKPTKPTKPTEPSEPGSNEPTEPGSNDPTEPGSNTPTAPKSTSDDPNAPTDPNASEQPADQSAACLGKRSGPGCGNSGSSTSLAGKLGGRRAGDGIADKTPASMDTVGYQGTPTPPSSPDAPAVEGGLDDTKAAAPAGSSLKSMNLKGYARLLVRGAGNSPADPPVLNMQVEPITDKHVIVETKDKGEDGTPADSRLPFSEVIGQSIDKAFGGNFGGKLQKLTQYHVANAESEALLSKIFEANTPDGNMVSIERDLSADSPWTELAQSANGGGLFRYSADHFDRLGGWQPVKVEIYKQGFDFAPELSFWHMTWSYGSV